MRYYEDGSSRDIVEELEKRRSAGRLAARTSELVQAVLIVVGLLTLIYTQMPAMELRKSAPVVAVAE
jgi:hypothetical protein